METCRTTARVIIASFQPDEGDRTRLNRIIVHHFYADSFQGVDRLAGSQLVMISQDRKNSKSCFQLAERRDRLTDRISFCRQ